MICILLTLFCLILIAQKNLLSKTRFENEIDLTKWNNDKYKEWIDLIKLRENYEHHAYIYQDEIPLKPMIMKYDKNSNILTIPLREGKYYVDDVKLLVDDNLIDELYELYHEINTDLKIY